MRRESASIHDETLPRDSFGELAWNVSVFLEVAAADRDHLDALPAELAQITPYRSEVELAVGRGVREDRQQIPVAVGAMGLSRPAAEQPDLFRVEHLDDPLDDAWRYCDGDHACKGTESARVRQATMGSLQPVFEHGDQRRELVALRGRQVAVAIARGAEPADLVQRRGRLGGERCERAEDLADLVERAGGASVSCSLGDLAVGVQATIAISTQAPSTAQTIVNTATVAIGQQTDRDLTNNSVSVTVTPK